MLLVCVCVSVCQNCIRAFRESLCDVCESLVVVLSGYETSAGPDQRFLRAQSHFIINGPQREKTSLRGFANNKGADQPAHPRTLISAFLFAF